MKKLFSATLICTIFSASIAFSGTKVHQNSKESTSMARHVLPNEATEAIGQFRIQWQSLVQPRLDSVRQQHVSDRMDPKTEFYVEHIPFQNLFKQVDSTLTEKEKNDLILYGSLADLNREGAC